MKSIKVLEKVHALNHTLSHLLETKDYEGASEITKCCDLMLHTAIENGESIPSQHQPLQVVKVKFRVEDNPFTATVRAVHFTPGKVKYDLGLWLGDGTVDNPEYETRIYNVDSVFVTSC